MREEVCDPSRGRKREYVRETAKQSASPLLTVVAHNDAADFVLTAEFHYSVFVPRNTISSNKQFGLHAV